MKEDKKIVDFLCKTCTHAAVCMHRSDLALLTDNLETLVKDYISKDTFPNGIVTVNVGCKSYCTTYFPNTPWSNPSTCC